MSYDPRVVEAKWQAYWHKHRTFRTLNRPDMPKYYVLDMIPYPSGVGLHVGHIEGYTASDVIARFMRMQGYDVLHPMGWDSFGLPAEQYAIDAGVHPADATRENALAFKAQCDMMGLSFDWEHEIDTSAPDYYRWTQWIFLHMLKHDLAYRADALVNWCPALGMVLANDEVIDGKSERGGHPVYRRMMKQWMLRITAYADRLLNDLDRVDFPEPIKEMQRNRIGRSEGVDLVFPVADLELGLEVFTTRPDTVFGATFCVLAPEHPLVDRLTVLERKAAIQDYKEQAARKSDVQRTGPDAGKTGEFTGGYVVNPFNGQPLQVWVSDYVLATYGTGAIMCVPAHDSRDWAFARRFDLPIKEVVAGGNPAEAAWEGDGLHVNSGFLDGLDTPAAIDRATAVAEERGIGKAAVRYRMRDWVFARQRYWGEPVPVVYDEEENVYPLPESELPLLLPRLEDFHPSGREDAPLARLKEWVRTTLPGTRTPAHRETHTMPTLAGSSWYFFRYVDPGNQQSIFGFDLAKKWLPVDLYVGGAEHAVGHLLYARFFTKFLYDLGLSPVDEPFARLVNQGMILGEDHRKMSKRYGNAIDPTEMVSSYGADALRIYELFMGPLETDKPWNTNALVGMRRFLDRVWRLFFDEDGSLRSSVRPVTAAPEISRLLHATIHKVYDDTRNLKFNTALAQMMTFVNAMYRQEVCPRDVMETFVLLLAPYAPHIAEEMWQRLGHGQSLARQSFPKADPKWLAQEQFQIAIQVNGKVCDRMEVHVEQSEEDIRQAALSMPAVKRRIGGRPISRVVYVKHRLLSITLA